MEFFSPQNVFKGQVSIEGTISANNHAVTKSYLEANAVVGIASDSANYAQLITVNGQKQLKLNPVTITDVAVDTSATSIGAWVTANYTNGDEKQEGDIIVLTAVSGRAQTFIHNGGVAGDATDFTEIEGADVTDAEIRGSLSASNGVQYNSATGAFTANVGEIRGFFAAGTGLSYDSANGTYSLNVDSDDISEGAVNLYYTDSRARSAISVSGGGIAYNGGTGVITLDVSTDDVTEAQGATNLWFTNQRAIDAFSVAAAGVNDVQLLSLSASGELSVLASNVSALFSAGTGLSYNNQGQFSLNADTSMVTEHANALYYTDARARGAISVGTGLAYNSGTGQIALAASSDNLSEGNTNLFFTQSRVRGAIQEDPAAGNMLTFDSSTGDMLVAKSDFRKHFSPQSLAANTWATLNHQLGEKIVHVSAYDSSGYKIQLDVQIVDQNNCKIRSINAVSNLEVVVSI